MCELPCQLRIRFNLISSCSSVQNTLEGQGGNDTVIGMDGSDNVVGADGDDILIGGFDLREIEPTEQDYQLDAIDFLYSGAGFDTYHAVRGDQIYDNDAVGGGQAYGDGQVIFEGITLTGGFEVPLGVAPGLSLPGTGLGPTGFTYYQGAAGEFYCIAETTYIDLDGSVRPTTICVVLKEVTPTSQNSIAIFDFDTTAESYLGIALTTASTAMTAVAEILLDIASDVFEFGDPNSETEVSLEFDLATVASSSQLYLDEESNFEDRAEDILASILQTENDQLQFV
ncbi:hypothetical protein [Pseudaestuariivita rosea]|uniref:hypothetical protein n=1 Tax=Pseudaestuariivita rosea TaxID=2763263 RepID=UPI001ABAF234|nr:hypothetical protein [Pseudaestuariivita rosea]